jgi:hypothetical protein
MTTTTTTTKEAERMIPYDKERDHWAPWIISIKGYVGKRFINMTKKEIEDRVSELLNEVNYIDFARDHDVIVTTEGRSKI